MFAKETFRRNLYHKLMTPSFGRGGSVGTCVGGTAFVDSEREMGQPSLQHSARFFFFFFSEDCGIENTFSIPIHYRTVASAQRAWNLLHAPLQGFTFPSLPYDGFGIPTEMSRQVIPPPYILCTTSSITIVPPPTALILQIHFLSPPPHIPSLAPPQIRSIDPEPRNEVEFGAGVLPSIMKRGMDGNVGGREEQHEEEGRGVKRSVDLPPKHLRGVFRSGER